METLKLEVGQNHVTQHVFENVLRCEEEGTVYTEERKYTKWSDEKHLISSDSHKYQNIGNAMEDGHGLRTTTNLVNDHQYGFVYFGALDNHKSYCHYL